MELNEYVSTNEWIVICGNDKLKKKCIHELELIRISRNKEFEAKSANFLNRDSFLMDDTLLGSIQLDNEIYQARLNTTLNNSPNKAPQLNTTLNFSPNKAPQTHRDFTKKYESNKIDSNKLKIGDNNAIIIQNVAKTYESIKTSKEQQCMSAREVNYSDYRENPDNIYDQGATSTLPSYPSLKDCDGDELLYFKQKCTALIFRNEELRIELLQGKNNLTSMKDTLFEKKFEFDS